jgi:hypothetical protein
MRFAFSARCQRQQTRCVCLGAANPNTLCAGRRRSELEPKAKALCNRGLEHVQELGLAGRAGLSAQACSGSPSFCGLLTDRCSRSLRPRQGFSLFFAPSPGWSRTGRKRPRRVLGPTLSSSSLRTYTLSTERKNAVLPNPSIERTSTGLARFTSLVYVPLRGPSQWRPAHVKR